MDKIESEKENKHPISSKNSILDYFSNFNYASKYEKKCDIDIAYGTAGFREEASLLKHITFRMGLLAVLRSKLKQAAVGLMITASHNLEPDNGIKLIDPAGEMLEVSWETIATDLANAHSIDLKSILSRICIEEQINLAIPATVIIGRDTRISSPELLNGASEGIRILGGTIINLEEVTTPQLHYIVACTNNDAYGKPTLQGYYSKLISAFKNVRGTKGNNEKYKNVIQLDAANGVGAIAAKEFKKYLNNVLNIHVFNDRITETTWLNKLCGADYVKVNKQVPLSLPPKLNVRSVSIDGDADRVVYFYVNENHEFHLMDGDRIATLIAAYFKELLETSGLSLQLGLIQTAYANGASTEYISKILKIPVACVPTGVKHLHKKAMEFDIGVYFEANGHGTVLFSDNAKQIIKNHIESETLKEAQKEACQKLRAMIDMINETVGDALSDILLVETILHAKGWDIIEWEKCYDEFPNKQFKIQVKNKNVVTTTDAERRCVTPEHLQDCIDETLLNYRKGRAFIRPSGTENVVRVYVECEGESDIKKLATEISHLVKKYVGTVE